MAIRSGTGGLKYPLPANTDIQASIAAASSGGSAAASSYGANRQFAANKMRVQADLANSAAERQFRAMSQLEGQQFRAQQEFYDREHQKGAQLQSQEFRAGEAELDRNFAAYQRMQGQAYQSNQAQLDRDFTTQRDQAQFDRGQTAQQQQIADQDAQIEAEIQAGTRELTPQAQQQIDTIAADRAKMAGDPQFTDAQREEAEKEFQQRERRIRRTAGAPRGPNSTQGFNAGTTYVDEETGQAYPTPDAVPGKKLVPYSAQDRKPLVEPPDTSKQDAANEKQNAALETRARALMKETVDDDTGEPTLTPSQAMNAAIEEQKQFDMERNRGAHPPMLPPAAPGTQQPGQPAPGQVPPPPAPGQTAPPTPLPGKPVGPTPTPTPLPQQPNAPAQAPVPLATPEPEVQTIVNDVRGSMKDVPLDETKETPALRGFLDKNMEDIVRYNNVPIDQVPEASRPALDFYGRYMRSATQDQPIVLKTPDEAAMLPPDTPFIDDKGKQRRTPKKKGAA
jgi:hypothetical protein